MESRTETVWGFCIVLAICSGTVQSACNEGAIPGHTFSSSSQSSSNPVTDVFKDSGWCAATDKPNEWVEISFPTGFGAKGFTIGSTTVDTKAHPSSVLVQYVPNGASDLQHFPLANGQPLVILLNNTGTSTMNLGTGIAVQRLRFLLQSYTGRACMKLAVTGCDIKDLCSPPCVNGGRCLAENQCLCANGFHGDSCETKPCDAAFLGIFDGRVPQKDITVSSEDPDYPKAQIGYSISSQTSNKGWCASDNDPAPWVQVKFDEPKSISTLYFFYINGPNQLLTFMRRFELQYIAPTDSSRTFRTFADNIDSLNGTIAIYVTMVPPVITDTIRIVSQEVEKRACFKLEMAGCDPSGLCQAGWCQNGGNCVGPNICKCPEGFLGNRCDQTKTDINTPVISFVNITQNILVTTTFTFSVTGSVSITQVNSTNVLVINGANSNIKIDKDTPGAECLNNIDNCQTGFTLSLDVNFGSLVDGTYIVSSGGDIAGHKGLALYYNQQSLTYIVTTANQIWSLTVHYVPILNVWQKFEITWNTNLGIGLFLNGNLLGTHGRPEPTTATQTAGLCIGCNPGQTSTVVVNMQILQIHTWTVSRTELVNAGIVVAPVVTTRRPVQTTPTTSQPTSTKKTTTGPTVATRHKTPMIPTTAQTGLLNMRPYDLTFISIDEVAQLVYTNDFMFQGHGHLSLPPQGDSLLTLRSEADQYLTLLNRSVVCLDLINSCKYGFTIEISVQVFQATGKLYMFTSIDNDTTSGVYLYFQNGQVYYGFRYGGKVWSGSVHYNIMDFLWHSFMLSWSNTDGITLLEHFTPISQSPEPLLDTSGASQTTIGNLQIGKGYDLGTNMYFFQVNNLKIWPYSIRYLIDNQIYTIHTTAMSTKSPTKPPTTVKLTTSISSVSFAYWTLMEQVGNVIKTSMYDLTTHGSVQLVRNESGDALIQVDVSNGGYLGIIGTPLPCLTNVQRCGGGLAVSLNILFLEINTSERLYLVSKPTTKAGLGISLYYVNSIINVDVIQPELKQKWSTNFQFQIELKKWYSIELNWSLSTGISLFINGIPIKTESSYTLLTQVDIPTISSGLTLGSALNNNLQVTFYIKGFGIGPSQVKDMTSVQPQFATDTVSNSVTNGQVAQTSTTVVTSTPQPPSTSNIPTSSTKKILTTSHSVPNIIQTSTQPSTVKEQIAFVNITANTLYTSHQTFTLHGNPVVVKTESGESAIQLSASSGSFIKMDNIKNVTCFGSGDNCDKGVTVGVSLSLVNIKRNESWYILSYKSNMSSEISFYTYYLNNEIYFGSKIANLTWSANVGINLAFNTFHTIELSISQSMGGIGLLIDGKLVKFVTKETSTNHFPDIQTTGLVIGQTTKTDTTTTVLIGGIQFFPKVSEILVDSLAISGVTTGKHTVPSSESTRHYSSTHTPSRYPEGTFQPSSTTLISELTSNLPTSTTSAPNTAINMAQTTSNQPTTSTESNVVSAVSQQTSTNSLSPNINILSSTVIHTSQNSHLHSNITTKSNVDTTITQQSSTKDRTPITTSETISYSTTSQQTQTNVDKIITQQSSTKDGTPNSSTASSIVSQGTQRHTNEPITTTEAISYSTTSRQTPLKSLPTTSEIQNQTTQFPISMGHIKFINITANTLYTSHNSFTLHGNPVIVKTASGESAIKLNASSGSFIKMDNIKNGTCFGSGNNCDKGVTVGVTLSLINIKRNESLYILSYKSNMSSELSFYTYYLNNKVYFGSKIANVTWSANVNFNIAFNTFHTIELSISQVMGGIGLLIDGKLVKYVTKETSTNHFPDIQTTGLVIGQTTKTDTTTTVLIGGIQFLPKVSEILVDSLPVPGVTTGKHTAPPSKSTRHYSSTQTPSRYPESTFKPSSTSLIAELTSNLPTSTTSTPNTAINMAQTTSNQPITSTESNVVSTVIQQTSSNSVAPTIHIAASTVYHLSQNPNGHSNNTTGSSVDATLFQQTSTKHWTPATSTASIISQGTQSNKPITSTEAISYSTTSQQTPTRSVSTSMPTVSEIQNLTTQFPISMGHIAFINITANTLYTSHNTFTLHGNPVVVKTESGESAIKLNASSGSFIKMDNTNVTCIGSGNNCGHGVTVGVSLKIVTIKQNESLYILSYRSNASASISFYVYYLNKMIYFGSKIVNVTWSSNVSFNLVFNTFHTIELSISQALGGIGLLIDGKLVKYVTKETSTNHFPDIQTTGLVIGQTAKTDTTTTVLIGGIQFWPKISQVLVESFTVTRGVTTGKTTTTPPKTSPTTTTTTTTTTTVATTTATPIPTFQWNLTTIPTSNVIVGPDFNLTIHGTPTSTDAGVELNSTTQYIELGSLQCLLNPFKCTQGLSVQFTIDFKFVQENTFVLTSGGQLPNGIGIAVIYRYGKYQFIVSTATHSWYATCGKNVLKPNKFHVVMLSWHTTIGLELIVDNTQIEMVTQPVTHEATLVTNTTVYFGKQPTDNIKFQYVIQTVSIWYAHVDILVSAGLCTKPERPEKPTTTVKPTPKPTTKVPPTAKPTASPTTKYTGTMTTKAPQCPVGCVAITSSPSKPAVTATSKPPVSATSKPPIKTDVPTTQKPTQKPTTQKPTTTPTPTTTPRTTPTTTERGAPNYNTVPTITATVTGSTNQAYLACAFSRPSEAGIEMTIALIINGNRVLVETVAGSAGIALFSVAQVNMNLYGAQISCSLVANYVGSSHSTQVFESKPYVPTFTVTPAQITVTEGHSGKPVTVQSTAPPQLYCCTGCRGQCQVHVVGIFKYDRKDQRCNNNNYISQAVIESTKPPNYNKEICGFVLTVANWKNTNQILVVGTLDNRRDGTQRRELKIEVNVYNQPPTAQITISPVTHVLSTTVKVTILDNYHSTYTCKSINDPHMLTFDGAHFNNMREGQFVMFKHKELPFEVRTWYQKCSKRSHATCNCGVAVQSGDDVITVIGCNTVTSGGHHPGQGHGIGLILQQLFGSHGHAHGHHNEQEFAKTPMTIQIYKNGQLTPGTYIRRYGCGQKYEIELPTGMIVTVQQSYKPFINIWIKASSMDRDKSTGLCGNFNGRRDEWSGNKGLDRFISEHVAPNNPFFNGVGAAALITGSTYCSCVENKGSVCSLGLGVMQCSRSRHDITNALRQQAKAPVLATHRRKRQVQGTEITATVAPDGLNLTESEMFDQCENYIMKGTVTQNCKPILTTNLTQQVENCVHDYNATESFAFATSALSDIVVDCVESANTILANNDTDADSNDTNVVIPIPDNLDDILANACVEECGDNGACQGGECECDDGFSGVTCNISSDTKPIVSIVPYLCDVSDTLDCKGAVVYGDNFVNSTKLTCHYDYIKVSEGVQVTQETGTIAAVFLGINQVMCQIPRLQSVNIRISNNGNTLSDSTSPHIVYDSRCYDCSIRNDTTYAPGCSRTDSNCEIAGQCYLSGWNKEGDACRVCNPAANDTEWSLNIEKTECTAQPLPVFVDNEDDRHKIIALAVVSAVLAAILLLLVVYIVKSRSSSKSKKEFGAYQVTSEPQLHRDEYIQNNPIYARDNEKL